VNDARDFLGFHRATLPLRYGGDHLHLVFDLVKRAPAETDQVGIDLSREAEDGR
jgi:hypothetical protein